MPLPRIVNASPRLMVRRRLPIFKYFFSPAQAARKATPCGTSPVLTMRQSAMSNLRARATIMILRAPRTSLVTDRYHCTRALYFWNMRKRQASWIMPRRTRALPGRCGQLAMQRVGVDLPRRRHVGARGPAAHGARRHQAERDEPEQRPFGATGGQLDADARDVHDHARTDFDEALPDCRELALGERAGPRGRSAHAMHQPERGGVKNKAHLIGGRAVT